MHIIVGGTSGIGKQLALRLLARGEQVHLLGRDAERLQEALQQLPGATGQTCDARDFAQVESVFQSFPSMIRSAVNCAGSILLKPAHLTTEQEYQDTLDLNLKTAFAVVRAAGKTMTSGGSVVLFSTAAARLGLPNHEAIAAAKGAVQGLALSAAATYAGRGLRFNVIAPGLVDTPLASRITTRPAALQASQAQHPLGRIGTAEEVASLADWLLSEQATWVTGQIFGIDGGLSALKGKA